MTIYNSGGNQIDIAQIAIYNNIAFYKSNQIKSNVRFCATCIHYIIQIMMRQKLSISVQYQHYSTKCVKQII